MADETIIADEQNEQVDVSDESEVDESQDESTDVETVSIDEFNKLKAKLEKVEGRYKSTQKKIASEKPKQETKVEQNVDLSSAVAKEIAKFKEAEDFKAKYGEEIYKDTLKVKEKHPTLSLEEAIKFSPIANDPARNANPESNSSPGRANLVNNSQKTITYTALSQLPQKEFNIMSDKVDS